MAPPPPPPPQFPLPLGRLAKSVTNSITKSISHTVDSINESFSSLSTTTTSKSSPYLSPKTDHSHLFFHSTPHKYLQTFASSSPIFQDAEPYDAFYNSHTRTAKVLNTLANFESWLGFWISLHSTGEISLDEIAVVWIPPATAKRSPLVETHSVPPAQTSFKKADISAPMSKQPKWNPDEGFMRLLHPFNTFPDTAALFTLMGVVGCNAVQVLQNGWVEAPPWLGERKSGREEEGEKIRRMVVVVTARRVVDERSWCKVVPEGGKGVRMGGVSGKGKRKGGVSPARVPVQVAQMAQMGGAYQESSPRLVGRMYKERNPGPMPMGGTYKEPSPGSRGRTGALLGTDSRWDEQARGRRGERNQDVQIGGTWHGQAPTPITPQRRTERSEEPYTDNTYRGRERSEEGGRQYQIPQRSRERSENLERMETRRFLQPQFKKGLVVPDGHGGVRMPQTLPGVARQFGSGFEDRYRCSVWNDEDAMGRREMVGDESVGCRKHRGYFHGECKQCRLFLLEKEMRELREQGEGEWMGGWI